MAEANDIWHMPDPASPPRSGDQLAAHFAADHPLISRAINEYLVARQEFAAVITHEICVVLTAEVPEAAYLVVAPGPPCMFCSRRNDPANPCAYKFLHPCVDGHEPVVVPSTVLDADLRPVTLATDHHAIRLSLGMITPMLGVAWARLNLRTETWEFAEASPEHHVRG